MKKNSFKRFLAVTLAAATALTFAPVSTLGLTGVVQAQAAAQYVAQTKTVNVVWDGTKSTLADGQSANVTVNQGDKINLVYSQANTVSDKVSATSEYTVTDGLDTQNQITVDKTVLIAGTGSNGAKDKEFLAPIAIPANAKIGTHALKIVIDQDGATATKSDETTGITLNVTVAKTVSTITNSASTASTTTVKVDLTDAESTPNAIATGAKQAEGETIKFKVTAASGYAVDLSKIDGLVTDSDSKKVPLSNVKVEDDGTVTGQFTMPAKNITINGTGMAVTSTSAHDQTGTVGTIKTTASNGSYVLGFDETGSIKGTDAADTAKAKKYIPSTSGSENVSYILVPYDADVTYSDISRTYNSYLSSTSVTAKSVDSNATVKATVNNSAISYGKVDKAGQVSFGTTKPTVTFPEGTTGTYALKLIAKTANGAYATADVQIAVSGSNNGSNSGVFDNTTTNDSDVFGGVTTKILATDNTSYSLVNSNADFVKAGTKYTANQLHWYLTTAPNSTPQNMGFTQGSATITESATGKLNIKVNNAAQFANDVNHKAYIVGIYESGSLNTIVYSGELSATPEEKMVTKTIDAGTISTTLTDVNKSDFANKFLDSYDFMGVNNKYLNGANSTVGSSYDDVVGRNFTATINDAAGKGDKPAKDSTLKVNAGNTIKSEGVYYEKYYVEYEDTSTDANGNGKFVAEISVNVSVNAGPEIKVKSGDYVFSATNDDASNKDAIVVDLDLTTNKTFDLKPYLYSNMDGTTYEYSSNTANVTVSSDGVVTAAKAGTAVVKITPTANGVKGNPVYVFFRVNQNANDNISVAGKDGDKADVFNTRQYAANNKNLDSEKALAAAQVGYIQIEVTGKETEDKKEALTTKGTGTLSFSLPKTVKGVKVDAKSGEITISHERINPNGNGTGFESFSFPVKVVSSASASSALTTGYFYVVVDYPDAKIEGLEKSYTVGTSLKETDEASWLDLSINNKYSDGSSSIVSANVPTGSYDVEEIYKSSELDDSKIYDDDDQNAFAWDGEYYLKRATVSDKTEHVLVSASDPANRIGNTYRVVEIKSVPGKSNYVTKIENVATGKTIYQADGVTTGAAITIDRKTVVKVTVAYAPDKSLNPKKDPAFKIYDKEDGFNKNTENVFVAATEDPRTYEITLIPSMEGTQIVTITPTEGRLTKTDYSLVDTEYVNLAVKYDSKALTTKPAKVTGVKVTNKKGAKVTVKFDKVTSYPTIRYYVQKKVGKKVSGKSVGSTKTTLSVKKGATVKVRVKAYYYDENGTKHVGKYSAWKTLKTDKK